MLQAETDFLARRSWKQADYVAECHFRELFGITPKLCQLIASGWYQPNLLKNKEFFMDNGFEEAVF
jgi:hypothetical protein